ncbi:MAG: laminin G domain-containing protein [Myxococcales bacterium]|nr:laminin G domain-containing protein [Myxococcales bacterium]
MITHRDAAAAAAAAPCRSTLPLLLLLLLPLVALAPCGCQAIASYHGGSATETSVPDGAPDGDLSIGDATLDVDGNPPPDSDPGCQTTADCPGGACVSGSCVADWWNTKWTARRLLTLFNRASTAPTAGATVAVVLETETLVARGLLATNCEGLRVVFNGASGPVVVPHHVDLAETKTCSSSKATEIYFQLQDDFPSAQRDLRYAIYYGNNTASPDSPLAAFAAAASGSSATLACPFRGSLRCAGGAASSTGTILHYGGGYALELDGVGDAVEVDLAAAASTLPPLDTGTFEMWFRLPAALSAGGATMGLAGMAGSSDAQLSLEGQVLRFRVGSALTLETGALALKADEWHHVALRWDAVQISLLLDGSARQTKAYSGGGFGATGVLTIGRNSKGYFRGFIDEVRLSSGVRGTVVGSEPRALQPDARTALLLHFDEGGGDPRRSGSAVDASELALTVKLSGEPRYVASRAATHPFRQADWSLDQRQPFASKGGVWLLPERVNRVVDPSFEAPVNNSWVMPVGTVAAARVLFGTSAIRVTTGALPEALTTGIANINEPRVAFFARADDGSALTSAIVRPIVRGTPDLNASFAYAGDGWWRVTSSPGVVGAVDFFGVAFGPNSRVDVDGVTVTTGESPTYIDGSLAAATYYWDADCDPTTSDGGNANASCSIQKGATGRGNTQMLSFDNSGGSRLSHQQGAISFWWRPDANVNSLTSVTPTFLQMGHRDVGKPGFHVWLNKGAVELDIFAGNPTPAPSVSLAGASAGVWQHIVASWSLGRALLYHNAVSGAQANFAPTSIDDQIHVGGGRGWTKPLLGRIADVRLFAGPLAPSDVTNLYVSSLVLPALRGEEVLSP